MSLNDSRCELRLGRWQDCLGDVECDALITDPPYSQLTHAGMLVNEGRVMHDRSRTEREWTRTGVVYAAWTAEDVQTFVTYWAPRVRGWIVVVTDDVLAPAFRAAFESAGRYAFPALPFVEIGKQPRLGGDGPASWTCWISVARPRHRRFQSWGSLPGGYVPPVSLNGTRGDRVIKGGKPLWLMQALVRDYSRPGDLICDPCAGGATTLLAAAIEGRRAIGAEMDPNTYALAQKRLARGYTPVLFQDDRPDAEQTSLFEADR